jgi:hypothetical protein
MSLLTQPIMFQESIEIIFCWAFIHLEYKNHPGHFFDAQIDLEIKLKLFAFRAVYQECFKADVLNLLLIFTIFEKNSLQFLSSIFTVCLF